MCKVTRIEWTYRTGETAPSDADTRIQVEIFRDGVLLMALGDTTDASVGFGHPETATRVAQIAASEEATIARPAALFEDFPNGVRGHLDVRFRVDGRDAWQIQAIESTVVLAEQRPVLGAIGIYEWRESQQRFDFDGVGVLAAEPSDETAILTLSY